MTPFKNDKCVVGTAVERNSRGKSRGDLMCRFPEMGGLHRTSGDAPLDTRNMSQSRRVVGTAVERNSWGKSRGDLMCRLLDIDRWLMCVKLYS